MTYKSKLSAAKFVRKSKLIIGLDFAGTLGQSKSAMKAERGRLESEALRIIDATAEHAVAFKINRHLVLPLGLGDGIRGIVKRIHEAGLTAIMDCKINDIGNTNEQIARHYFEAGFDAVIVNPLVGMEGGLDGVFNVALDEKMKNHEPLYISFAKRARNWDVDGVIVGATFPDKIQEIKKILGNDVPIISPGVGAQGGSAREAMDAGASYVIVARAITEAEDPGAAAKAIADEIK
ncbi:MAG: orotidine 5'-phosphate decarboxylase [Candidatus Thorarchaeota archaeon]|jgi:orotidine-5'-phosphate decarboxylase